ncbi:MAG TPA: glycosyltransferase family 2 protein [Thermodesulfovibrionales bacterium]|nr:glycosyltransferase family 2 protein [Thermodesulfovibrionales bacterium]
MNAEKLPLSVAIITKNEERRLPACLESVSFAEEIVVVDSGSSDRTVEIAEEFGCRVFVEDWKGDGPQKNSAIEKCTHEWVLIVDADERIPKETREEINRVISNSAYADAYSFPRRNYFHGRWIKYSGWWPDRIIRLVRKSKGRFEAITHGKWATSGTLAEVDVPIDHYSFTDYSNMLLVMETRSTDMAKELLDAGTRANILTPFLHGLTMFLKVYILKLGFLDGLDGFVIAVTRAGGTFFKYAKLLELQRAQTGKDG